MEAEKTSKPKKIKKDPAVVAKDIANVFQDAGITSFTNCMTRLRITATNPDKVDKEAIKKIPNVIGLLVAGKEFQVILGPGFVNDVRKEFEKLVDTSLSKPQVEEKTEESLAELGKRVKAERKAKFGGVQEFFAKFTLVFAPMIPAFIGAGIMSGIAGIIRASVDANNTTAYQWSYFFGIFMAVWAAMFLLIVGWRTAKVWGGTGALGAIAGAVYISYAGTAMALMFQHGAGNDGGSFLGINVKHIETNWLTSGLSHYASATKLWSVGAAHGSVFGVMLSAWVTVFIEKQVRKFMPNILDTAFTPFLVLVAMMFINVFLIIPTSGYMTYGITFVIEHAYNNPFGSFLLAGILLTTVAFGMNQGFVPVYATLLAEKGINSLSPVLAMAGQGLVGTAAALWLMSPKEGTTRKQISGAIVPGILGIGEPLIYGMALPRILPFIAGSLGGAFGGFFIGAINFWGGTQIGISTLGASGLLAIPVTSTADGNVGLGVGIYVLSVLVAWVAGFGTMWGARALMKYTPKFATKINWSLAD